MFQHHFNTNWLTKLEKSPDFSVQGEYQGHAYQARIVIPEYHTRLVNHYRDVLPEALNQFCQHLEIPYGFHHLGVQIDFEAATELALHNSDGVLDEGLRQIIARTGPVIIRNAYMVAKFREGSHRNRFPHLNFHIDRSANQPTQYSMYTRNPFDDEQQHPRTSSTLFVPSIVGPLQAIKEGNNDLRHHKGLLSTYTIFENEQHDDLMNNIILEHRWDMPEGTGEISMLDNRTVLHSSYYRDELIKGYKIGVRYLS